MRNNLKKVMEATPCVAVLESEYKTKNREVKRSTRRDKRSHVEKFYKIIKELVKTNTKADPPIPMETSCVAMQRS